MELHGHPYKLYPLFDQPGFPLIARKSPPDKELPCVEMLLFTMQEPLASIRNQAWFLEKEISALHDPISRLMTVPLRWIKAVYLRLTASAVFIIRRNIRRLQVVFVRFSSLIYSFDGVLPAGCGMLNVLKSEGWSGFVYGVQKLKHKSANNAYKNYISTIEPKENDLNEMAKSVANFSYRPKFSIVVPVYNVDARWLTCFIESVLAQVYPDWELCIADDHSSAPHVRPLLEVFAGKDCRIRLVFRDANGHISEATNSALEMATGDFVCLMDNDDEISPHALYEFASMLNRDESIDMIYSDEDKLDMEGNRYGPFFKPDWSPEAIEGCMYTSHFACYRMKLVREIGVFRSAFNGAQDYDFVLRFTERSSKIVHVPKILYHWRAIPGSTASSMDMKHYVIDAAVRALTEHAKRMAGSGLAKPGFFSGSFDLRYVINDTPLVSIVIPSAGRTASVRGKNVDLLAQAVSSIHKKTTYRNFEIIIVDNNDLRLETLKAIQSYGCRHVHFDGDFNIASKMNIGAQQARGDYLLFMHDDIEVITADWMECMLQLCQRKEVGVVGAKLYYKDKSLQHAGVAFWNGLPDNIYRAFPGSFPGYFFSAVTNRNYLAVSGAVLMTKQKLFKEVSGFDKQFAINYSDIDYCLKVFMKSSRIVFAAGARLFHYESVSRDLVVAPEEIELFQKRWKDIVSYDPYYSPFFDNHPPNFELRHDWSSLSGTNSVMSPIISHR
jgi:O-antigen biosynthesis protein